jgi:predicted nucleic acid-binding protein
MAFLFLDTNAFIKLFLNERGSTWIRNFIVNNEVIVSELTWAEATNTLTRLYRDGTFTQADVSAILTNIDTQIRKFVVIPLEVTNQLNALASLGFGIPNNLRLRTLDAFQLIAAEIANTAVNTSNSPATFFFVSSDRQLLQVAQARGFATENPENYP